MASFRDLLKAAKAEITEVDTAGAAERIAAGALRARRPRARRVRRRARSPARCTSPAATSRRRSRAGSPTRRRRSSSTAPAASARRSPPARCRSSATPTSSRWTAASAAGRTRAGRGRRRSTLTADQSNRYQRHLLLPEVGVEGQAKLLGSKVLLLGAGGLGSPGRAVPRRRRRRHDRHRRHGRGRRLQPAAPDPAQPRPHRRPQGRLGEEDADAAQPRRRRRHLRHPPRRPTTSSTSSPATTSSSTAPTTSRRRYLLNDASVKLGIPVVHGSIFRFEGMVSVFHPLAGPDLPRHGARAAARRAGPELRRGRRARRAARHRRLDPGAGGDQGPARPRRAADRADPRRSTRPTCRSARSTCKPDPANAVTYANRDRIQVRDLDGLCARRGSTDH